MLKKMIGSFTLACTLLTSSQLLMPAKRADALIIAAFTHNHHAKHDYCLAGIICIFFIPPLGLILNSESLIDDFDKRLEFLAQTNEGNILKSELHKLANSVEVRDGVLQVRKKEYKKIRSQGMVDSKEDLLSRVKLIENDDNLDPQEKVNGQIALSRSFVKKVLDQGDYTESEKNIAYTVLCQ